MVANYLETPVLVLLIAVMMFNLSQRSHMGHGERKRFATLYIAGILLFLDVELLLIRNLYYASTANWILLPALLIAGMFLILFRKKIFIFSRFCRACGNKLDLQTSLYFDDNLCASCRTGVVSEAKSDEGRNTDPLINPPDKNLLTDVPRSVDDFNWETWEPSETAVLCYVFKDDQVLLIHKKRGLGRGKVNAPGGRIEAGETPVETAVRELQEEVGITPLSPFEVASLSFVFTNGYSLKGHVFFARDYEGTVVETDEADPFWVPVKQIPYEKMWEDDKLWLPRVIDGSFIDARFIFEGDSMVSHQLTEIAGVYSPE